MSRNQAGPPVRDWEPHLLNCLSERRVASARVYSVAVPAQSGDRITLTDLITNGQAALIGVERVEVVFTRRADNTYQLQFNLPKRMTANGVGARFRLRGWSHFRYVAIGYSVGPRLRTLFRHVKIPNPAKERWIDFVFCHGDLIYGIQNNWRRVPDFRIRDVRIYISGTPASDVACLDVEELLCCRERQFEPDEPIPDTINATPVTPVMDLPTLLEAVYGYLCGQFLQVEFLVKGFVENRRFPIPIGSSPVQLEWPPTQPYPKGYKTNMTYRYSWHALHVVSLLMLHERETGENLTVATAVAFVDEWLDRSYFQVDEDQKYAWYDHGVAERCIALALMWECGVRHCLEQRLLDRLESAILRHGQLLESEAFYASHQGTRWHNHAWFQDIALIVISILFSQWPCASRWLDIALLRLREQHLHLIEQDGEFAVLVENSIDYHHGVHRLVTFVQTLVSCTKEGSFFESGSCKMLRFSELLRYPNGRSPSQGDTFRLRNPEVTGRKSLVKHDSEPICAFLPIAGYGVIRGNHDSVPYMLAVFATSLSATHKHEDNLSFTLYFDEIEWLLDPSFHSYEYTQEIPSYLRSAVAHNALAIPSLSYSIEPGLASLSGRQWKGYFVLSGMHEAYSDVRIAREVSGSVNILHCNFLDRAEADKSCMEALFLMFHCGDGVDVRLTESNLFLSHPASCYELHISLPECRPKVYKGSRAPGNIRGVTGMGFEELVDISTVECRVALNTPLKWSLRAVKRDGNC